MLGKREPSRQETSATSMTRGAKQRLLVEHRTGVAYPISFIVLLAPLFLSSSATYIGLVPVLPWWAFSGQFGLFRRSKKSNGFFEKFRAFCLFRTFFRYLGLFLGFFILPLTFLVFCFLSSFYSTQNHHKLNFCLRREHIEMAIDEIGPTSAAKVL